MATQKWQVFPIAQMNASYVGITFSEITTMEDIGKEIQKEVRLIHSLFSQNAELGLGTDV